jgi:hypothetical protein
LTSGGLLRVVPIFTGEISETRVRGEFWWKRSINFWKYCKYFFTF